MNTLLITLALLQDPKVEALEKRIAELEKKVEGLENALRALLQGQGAVRQAMDRALQRAKETSCANNLRQLWTLEMTYSVKFGGRLKKMPEVTGPDFWLALSKTEPPLVDVTMLDVYVCPLRDDPPEAGFTTYRGPSKKIGELKGDDVVGCCVHPDGSVNALYKNGEVSTHGAEDPAAKAAINGTLGSPRK